MVYNDKWMQSPLPSWHLGPSVVASLADVQSPTQQQTSTLNTVLWTCNYQPASVLLTCLHPLSLLFFSRPWSEGWPHHGHTFSIYPCPLSFWLTLPRRVLSTSWCCPSRPCVVFLAFVHLALFLALSLSPDNSLVSLFWQCLTVPSLLQLC